MKTIKVDKSLQYCPKCGYELNYGSITSNIPTTCGNCNFYEKAGSLHLLTFLSRSVAEYCTLQGINAWDYKGTIIPIHTGMASTALLPLIANRSNFLSQENNVLHSISGDQNAFVCQRDNQAWMKERVCCQANYDTKDDAIYLLTQEIIKFTSVVSEAMDIGKSLSLKSDVLYANSIMSNQSISDELALESNQLDLDMGLE